MGQEEGEMNIDEAARLSKEWHEARDAHAAQAQAEGKQMAQEAITEISNKVGFYNRSAAQVRRYERAKKNGQGR